MVAVLLSQRQCRSRPIPVQQQVVVVVVVMEEEVKPSSNLSTAALVMAAVVVVLRSTLGVEEAEEKETVRRRESDPPATTRRCFLRTLKRKSQPRCLNVLNTGRSSVRRERCFLALTGAGGPSQGGASGGAGVVHGVRLCNVARE